MRIALTSIVFLCASSTSAVAESLSFSDHGRAVRTITVDDARALVAPASVTVAEPHESRPRTYLAIDATKLLDAAYGAGVWRKAEEILFTCRDGFQVPIPTADFGHAPAFFAIGFPDGAPFHIANLKENEPDVELGPFYLVWTTPPSGQAVGGDEWPYQIVGADLIEFADRYPNIVPPPRSPAAVTRGFHAFVSYCLACHTLNGQGGAKAPELNYPVNVTEYYRTDWLKRWIDDPTKIRFSTTMPALAPETPDRARTIDDLVAYLAAMRSAKRAPPPKTAPAASSFATPKPTP